VKPSLTGENVTSTINIKDHPHVSKSLSRDKYLKVVGAALDAENYHFARELVLNWLATYPGDLLAGLYYAQTLVGENRISQALPILEGLCMADPESVGAVETLIQIADVSPTEYQAYTNPTMMAASSHFRKSRFSVISGSLESYRFALTGKKINSQDLESWGVHLLAGRQAIDRGEKNQAELEIKEAMTLRPDHPLTYVSHLRVISQRSDISLQTKSQTARTYHNQWPDCLACMLWVADWSMEGGDSALAVALLHQAAARDIGGQVAERLWGSKHAYRSLWPERLELVLDTPIPADVAAVLGWNRLPPGNQNPFSNSKDWEDQVEEPDPYQDEEEGISVSEISLTSDQAEPFENLESESISIPIDLPVEISRVTNDFPFQRTGKISQVEEEKDDLPVQDEIQDYQWALESEVEPYEKSCSEDNVQDDVIPTNSWDAKGKGLMPEAPRPVPPGPVHKDDLDIESISEELEQIAERMRLPGLTQLDGRFPVYVVLTGRNKLQAIYGYRAATIIESEMNLLVQAVRERRGWGALIFLADDPVNTKSLGIEPAKLDDPWELKLALGDLDNALRKRGQRIGVVLIVGGPEVVPFHHLPNPLDDQDVDVPSDNPYATRNENYFIPEWPVGRLPGGAGEDAEMLVTALRNIRQYHEVQSKQLPWFKRYLKWLRNRWEVVFQSRSQNFGYTAAVWKKMAAQVFRPIGKPDKLYVSPPIGDYPINPGSINDGMSNNGSNGHQSSPHAENSIPSPRGRLGYFNLHGLVDAIEWFGQRDLMDQSDGPDYPVALRPEDIPSIDTSRDNNTPQIVFTEACYGLHIQNRTPDEAISLKFLEAGSLAVVGSTCMAYGSIQEPLAAADLLGHSFWTFLKQGMTAGEALRHAKIYLAGEMNRRQGYLDGEDQKTLISFALYGDPLAQATSNGRIPKITRFQDQPLSEIRTVCDRVLTPESPMPVPKEVFSSVMKVVSQYLPGMSDAHLTYAQEREQCKGEEHACPTNQINSRQEITPKSRKNSRRMVLLSKNVTRADGIHPQYARLTLDEEGELVKLVVSR